jgi:hypothetical protein
MDIAQTQAAGVGHLQPLQQQREPGTIGAFDPG